MTVENMFELIGNAEEDMIADAAKTDKRKHPVWLRWGAVAACVCLLAAGVLALAIREQRGYTMDSGTGMKVPSRPWFPEGVDPKIVSMGIYPATEKVQDVLDTEVISLSEDEALAVEGLSERLPASLPEDYVFSRALLYTTTMKSGQTYHLLRAEYRKGEADGTSEDTATPRNMFSADGFFVSVMDFTPRTDEQIYDYMPLTDTPAYAVKVEREFTGNDAFILHCNDVYVTISPESLGQGEVKLVVDAVTEGLVPVR